MNVFRSFFTFRVEMHVRCDNQYKTGADRENILGQLMLFVCMGICVLSPAHESEMKGYLVYVMIVKNLFHWFCLNSGLIVEFFKTFLEGSVDRIIYRDYKVNRRFFIYCSLATAPHKIEPVLYFPSTTRPWRLTCRWWGCYSLYLWHELSELAHSFLLCPLWPFQLRFIP